MAKSNKTDDNENKKVIELSRLSATLVCNTLRVQRTGQPMTDEQFVEMYENLPNTVQIEMDSDDDSSASKSEAQKLLGNFVGNGGSFRSKAREKDYDEVRVVLELNTPGRVNMFKRSPYLLCRDTPVAEHEFQVPESANPQNEMYKAILDDQGVFGTYSEMRPVTVVGQTAGKTSKVKSHSEKLVDVQEGSRSISLNNVVPVECRGLFKPTKANVFTFISSKDRNQMDSFLGNMSKKYGNTKEQMLVYLLGLYNQITESDVKAMQNVLETNDVSPENLGAYRRVMSATIESICDDGYKPSGNDLVNESGSFDIERAISEIVGHNEVIRNILAEGRKAMGEDKCIKVLLEKESSMATLGIISNYLPTVMTTYDDMGPVANIDFLWNLMELAGGLSGSTAVSVTVKDCDAVSMGAN